jgi:hypothetical protein
MNRTTIKAKVYYLPAAEPVVAPPTPSRWTRLRRRVVRSWWRARLSLADVRLGLWRPSRGRGGDDYAALLRSVITESPAELIERPKRKPTLPAKIFDFEAARLRLRPATD